MTDDEKTLLSCCKFENFKDILQHMQTLPWNNDVDNLLVYFIAQNNFNSLKSGCTKNKNYIRLCGQSGSGKSTQLLPTTEAICNLKNIKPITFNVREFAPLHPNYNNLLKEFGSSKIREKTNGFALTCLLFSLIMAISSGYDIILEVTLLSKKFEEFVYKYLSTNCYSCIYLCLAVNKQISDSFIEKRKIASQKELGREVSKKSSIFFETAISPALAYLATTCKNSRIIIWNACNYKPIYDGKLSGCLSIFNKEKQKTSIKPLDENKLLAAKIDYIKKNL